MSPTNWFSEKAQQHVEIETMNVHHARAALAKLERGAYLGADGNPPSVQDHILIRSALQRRMRVLDSAAPDLDETTNA